MKILVMGLPGSGKTYLTQRLVPILNAAWYNADQVRKMSNDWDFSDEGRKRQSMRMKTFADFEQLHGRYVVCDFVCPTKETRENFDADIVIWMDTIKGEDTKTLISFSKILTGLIFILQNGMSTTMMMWLRRF